MSFPTTANLPAGLTGAAGITGSYTDMGIFRTDAALGMAALLVIGLAGGHSMNIRLVTKDVAGNVFLLPCVRMSTGELNFEHNVTAAGNEIFCLDTCKGAFREIYIQAYTSSVGSASDTLTGQVNFGWDS